MSVLPEVTVAAGELVMGLSPRDGNRIASLRSRASGREFLWQDPHPTGSGGTWAERDGSGWADCFPTVAAAVTPDGLDLGDHGWLWSQRWSVHAAPSDAAATGPVDTRVVTPQGLAARRVASAAGEGAICLRYRLENRSSRPLPALFAAHPLLAVTPASRLILPPDVTALRQRVPRREGPPAWLPWPGGHGERLDIGLQPTAGIRQKLFTGRLAAGWAVLFHPEVGEGIALHFDPAALPYLGIWRAQGFVPLVRPGGVYALGLEPTNWPWETPLEGDGPAPVLPPGEAVTFAIGLQLLRLPEYAGDGPPPAFPTDLRAGPRERVRS